MEELAAHREGALPGVVAAALGLPPVDIEVSSGSPRGGGLGASSAVTVALIAAGELLLGRPPRDTAGTARLARDLEARLMRLPTGTQDHYPALLGGSLAIGFAPGGETVRRLDVDLTKLGRHLLVVYSGQSHFSAATNWTIIRRCLEGMPRSWDSCGASPRWPPSCPNRSNAATGRRSERWLSGNGNFDDAWPTGSPCRQSKTCSPWPPQMAPGAARPAERAAAAAWRS